MHNTWVHSEFNFTRFFAFFFSLFSPYLDGKRNNRPLTVIEVDPGEVGENDPGPPIEPDPLDLVIATVPTPNPSKQASMLFQMATASRGVINRFASLLAEGRATGTVQAYQDIQKVGLGQACTVALQEMNQYKNR